MNETATIERAGEAFEGGEQLTVVGPKLSPGDTAPNFTLDAWDDETSTIQTITLAETAGSVRLLHVVNSLDTPVCHTGAHRFEDARSGSLPPGVQVYTISMDLPFAQARWKTQEGVTHRSLSAHKSEQFGRDWGVLLKEWRLLQRAVFVVGRDNKIVHAEYVADQMNEPDYEAAFTACRLAASAA